MRFLAILVVLCFSVTAVAADDPILTVPQLEKPGANQAERDPLQAKYDAAWTKFEQAVSKATAEVTKALDAQFEKAADAGNLELADMWDKKKKFFLDTKTLEWASDGKGKVEWRKKHPTTGFPDDFSETLKTAKQAYNAAVEELTQGYEAIVREYTKARNLERAKQLKEELLALTAAPVRPPVAPRPASETFVLRVAISETGDVTVSAEQPRRGPAKQMPANGVSRKQKVGGGWDCDYSFTGQKTLDAFDSLTGVSFDRAAVGLAMTPSAEASRKAWVGFRGRLLAPFEIEVEGDALAADSGIGINLTGGNASTTNHVTLQFNRGTGGDAQPTVTAFMRSFDPEKKRFGDTQTVFTHELKRIAPSMKRSFRLPVPNQPQPGYFQGGIMSGQSSPVVVRRIQVSGRLVPTFGMSLDAQGNAVFNKQTIPGSVASEADVRDGDILLGINGKKPSSVDDALALLGQVTFDETCVLQVQRGDEIVRCELKASWDRPFRK